MTLTPITITHLGAESCVTGSCHLVGFQPDHGGGILRQNQMAEIIDIAIYGNIDKLFIIRPQMLVRLHIKPHGKQGELG
ncbi:hypothetical protein Dpo_5c03770 [Desulfotignum phosphitoxidans DSM 13687]|jgi:hypothetical protein|uniref:Uncharacterized protein n=1 Tax=Desulfotignum phosphitoxidans DSM 13687 TaxID=1286635 RepID=S0FXI3_9BACT|nr:hypothetical protein Dpo_5c03770 [Desulfotignum phosphitoxidans DSM 13687]